MHIPYYGIIKVEELMFNNVSLVGRLTDDPVTKESQLGKSYTSFCIAVDRKTKDKEADFFNCTLFGRFRLISTQTKTALRCRLSKLL
jgi:single-stranded DNA-binding protein